MAIKNQITSDTQIHIMQTCKHAHMRMQNENIMQRIIHAVGVGGLVLGYWGWGGRGILGLGGIGAGGKDIGVEGGYWGGWGCIGVGVGGGGY